MPMHQAITPLAVIDISRLKLHDTSSFESTRIWRELTQVFSLFSDYLTVYKLVVLKFASII